MNEESTHFLQQLRASVEGVLFSSAGDYPFGIFRWDLQEDSEFNIKNFLQRQGYLEMTSLSDAFGLDEYSDGYQRCGLLTQDGGVLYGSSDFLDEYLKDCQKQGVSVPFLHINEKREAATQHSKDLLAFINWLTLQGYKASAYRISKKELPVYVGNGECSVDHRAASETYESSRLLTIEIENEIWVAISSYEDWADYYNETHEKYIFLGLQNDPQAHFFLKDIQGAAQKLAFIRRNFYDRYEISNKLIFEIANSQDAAISRVLHGNGFINTYDFDGFSLDENVCMELAGNIGPNNKLLRERITAIDELLKSHLSNLRKIYIGTHSVYEAYFIGQDTEGNRLGLCTVDS
ncbi:MAG: nuclease A inhibitor family protein [Cyanobacteria bacterium P01_D01_bin.115]